MKSGLVRIAGMMAVMIGLSVAPLWADAGSNAFPSSPTSSSTDSAIFSSTPSGTKSTDTTGSAGSDSGGGSSAGSGAGDIFSSSAFKNAISQTKKEKSGTSYMVGGSFLFNAAANTTAAFDGYTTQGAFSGKLFGKVTVPFYGQLYLSYDLQHTLFQGAGGSLSSIPIGSSLLSNDLVLSEFFFDFNIAHTLFVRVGNQLVAWGPSNVWTPVDFINTRKASSLQTVDLRVGKPGVKLFLPFPSWDVTLFSDFSNTIQNGQVADLSKATNLAFRTSATIAGFEWGLSGYLGESIQNRYGFDFSGSLLGASVYGELAMLFPYGSYAFNYAASLGAVRSFGDLKRWTAQVEAFYNSAGTDTPADYPAMIASQSFVPLYVGKEYAYLSLTKQEFLASFLNLTASGIANLSDQSYRAKLSAAFSVPGLVPFTASVAYNGGGAKKEFTYFSGNNALTLDLQVLAQF